MVEGFTFDQPSGNAVMFSNAVFNSTIRKNYFQNVGDSAIAMLGSTRLMLGTAGNGLFPTNNLIEGNLVDTVGVYGKQTSAYFKGKSNANTVRNNVFMNGPRAGVNFNDGTAGGEVRACAPSPPLLSLSFSRALSLPSSTAYPFSFALMQ